MDSVPADVVENIISRSLDVGDGRFLLVADIAAAAIFDLAAAAFFFRGFLVLK